MSTLLKMVTLSAFLFPVCPPPCLL
ncbi:hypothetical protein OIU78_027653, partial [Salix suchowensis]